MDSLDFEIDFQGVTDKSGIIKKLVSVFRLPDSPDSNWNWDAFEDYFTNLDSDSGTVRNSNPKPNKIHLVIKNIQEVKKASETDYDTLLSVLDHATKKENRGDQLEFTYNLAS